MDGRTTEAVKKALRALQAPAGATARQVQEKSGWIARPHSTSLKLLASRHGFIHSKRMVDGVLMHKFTPKATKKSRGSNKEAARAEAA
jgi:hypothetical protein